MQDVTFHQIDAYHPTTFLERGVSVPFTTPILAGSRARPSIRYGIEVIVPNPSGGRGVYILPWNGVTEMFQPTVHDHRLCLRVAELPAVSPSAIRRAARAVLAEGLAGHDARDAAETAYALEADERLVTNYTLLMNLVGQVESISAAETLSEAASSPAEIERRAKQAIALIAPALGHSPESVAEILEQLAAVLAPIGLGSLASSARAARDIDKLIRLRDEAREWGTAKFDDVAPAARLLADVAQITIVCAQRTLEEARRPTGDVVALLHSWTAAAEHIGHVMSRPEWLLDGWSQICVLWDSADTDESRKAIMPELSILLPVLPREASEWAGLDVEAVNTLRFRRFVNLNVDWRTGMTVYDQIARNEKLRALAA